MRPSRRREKGKEGGEGKRELNAKKTDGEEKKKGEKDAQELHQFLSARNKKHCVREWELVSSGTRRVQ